jgi:hypothetical protein
MSANHLAPVKFVSGCAAFVAVIWLVAPLPPARAQSTRGADIIGRFAGTWKEDATKRKFGAQATLRFRRNAKGELEEVRGPEARPVVQTIVFDGQPHATESVNRIAWKQINPNAFERVLTDGTSGAGRILTTRRLRISADDKILTEDTERKTSDGRTSIQTVAYRRTSGEPQGLAGRWQAESMKTNSPPLVKYERAGPNGLKFTDYDGEATYTLTLDGKPVPVVGPAVIRGIMVAAKPMDDHTIEITQTREGVTTAKGVSTVSADGKTLTVTVTPMGPNASPEPSTIVYVKQ